MSEIESVIDEYFEFLHQLVKMLMSLQELYKKLKYSRISELAKKSRDSFFLDNLFLLKHFCSNDRAFNADQRRLIKKLYSELNLYHYTTYRSLKKIIEGKSLKLNHISNLNDDQEGKILANIKPKCKSEFDKLYNETYSFSFTTCKDDAPQWDRYSRSKLHGNREIDCGVCIQIPMPKLIEFVEKIRDKVRFVDLVPILYSQGGDMNEVYIDSLIKCREKLKRQDDLTHDELLIVYSCATKNETFKTESEIRLLLLTGNTPSEYVTPVENESENYVLLKFGEYFSELLSSIIIDSGASDHVSETIRKLLTDNGLNVSVIESKNSLRTI